MSSLVVLGCDPGGSATGLVLVQGDRLLDHRVVRQPGSSLRADYVQDVLAAAERMVERVYCSLVAIELVTAPVPHMGTIAVGGLLGAAAIAGALIAFAGDRDVILVPPQSYGSAPLAAYPPKLIGPRERSGSGVLRHARSAWDVAHAGLRLWRAPGGGEG